MLKLQKVELLGFKSFAERTEIAFHGAGVAAVVGPNGCGKSNISDAIHWVLGEQSAKTLRSGRMQDVLFNGTPERKATGLAEVKLTLLDPEAMSATEPAAAANGSAIEASRNGDGGVITVARRLFASGESEYLLNDRACRLRDIQEIFLGTGLGPDSYAIIEQGRIGQILSAKPYERRALIEEAAGITRFKAKRKLAWAKLESSKQNLARVSDILEEVSKQLHSLQRQAARARRYKELREQVQAQLRKVLGSRARQTEEQAAQTALELSLLRGVFEEQGARTEQHEGALRELHQQLEQLELELRQAAEERTTLRVEAERARGQVTTHAQQIAYAVRRVEEARAEQAQIQARQDAQRPEREQCARMTAQLQQEREALEGELRGWEASLRLCQQDLEEKEQRREQLSREILEAVGQAAELRNQLSQQEQYLGWTTKQIGQLDSQDSEMEAAQEAAVLRCRHSEELLRREGAEREQVSARRAEREESLRQAKEEESRCRRELEELRTQLAAERARLRSLEEILARHAYSTETVQRLFEAQVPQRVGGGSGSGAHAGRRFETAGLLADFLEVEPAYERVVEEFLREELEYVVVKDWSVAERAVHLLRTELPGRATFLLETAAASRRNGHGSGHAERKIPAGVRPLASCVRFTNGFSGSAGSLLPKLDGCYLVADAGQGRELAAEHPESYFLTPEGIWFQGALVSAGKADCQGPLALKRELRGLAAKLADSERAVEEETASLNRTVQQITEQQAELQRLTQQQQDYEKRLMLAERDQREAAADAKRIAERLALLALERERLEREAERTRGQWSQNNYEIAQCEQRRAELEAEVQAVQAEASERKAQREAAQVCETELRSRLAGLEERQRTAAESLARLEQAAEQLTARSAELEAQCVQWANQRTQWEQESRSLVEQSVAADRRAEELTARMAEMESRATGHRQSIQEREQETPRLRQELEQTREKRSAAEVQLARLQSEMGHLRETCRNELGVELETLTAAVGAAPSEGAPVFGTALERALAKDTPLASEALAEAEEQYRQLRTKLENLGPINMMALEEFEECRTRHEFLETQRQDLQDSIRDTTQAIGEIDAICNRQFAEAFEQIGAHFQRTFTQLFGGGQGMLRLLEVDEPADAPAKVFGARQEEAGIEIIAQPPGKRLQSVLLLSGGEKALAALALLVAIFRYKPSPFCILDEVDAPLDDANIGRFTELVQEMSRDTQFILITHSKRTMSIAPVMYGVTMQEPGVSKIVSVRFHGAAGAETTAASSQETASSELHTLAEAVA